MTASIHDLKPDRIEKLPCGSLIQHGAYNDRIYLMKAGRSEAVATLPERLVKFARGKGYGKIFVKAPGRLAVRFDAAGYRREAVVPGLFRGEEDGVFLAYYLSEERATDPSHAELDAIVELAAARAGNAPPTPDAAIRLRCCDENDAQALARIYRKVFPQYPFPVHDPVYLAETMRRNILYFGIEAEGRLVAASSAETDPDSASSEMTDFATLPEWRGRRLAERLLAEMETRLKAHGFHTAFTIARAQSAGMNVTFARAGYTFDGRLIRNTRIADGIESMNVWHKPLSR